MATIKILYDSVTGNTKQVCEAIAEALEFSGIDVTNSSARQLNLPLAGTYLTDIQAPTLEIDRIKLQAIKDVSVYLDGADAVILGTWNRRSAWSPAMSIILPACKDVPVLIVQTSGSVEQDYQVSCREKLVAALPREATLLGTFICQGKMRPSVRKGYETGTDRHGYSPEVRKKKILNYDKALSHPDNNDLEAASSYVLEKLQQSGIM